MGHCCCCAHGRF